MSNVIHIPRIPAFDTLHHAVGHLRRQFRMDMTRDEAQANLDARALLYRLEVQILDAAEQEMNEIFAEETTC